MDMNAFRGKYDEANKKFFGKGRALAALTAELQAFAAFRVETDQIPVYLTDVAFYQQEAQDIAGAKEQLSFEWKQLLEISFEQEETDWMESRMQLCECILENASSLKDWIIYRQFAAECRQSGLGPVCDAYEGGLSHDEVMAVYLRSVYRAIILSVIEQEPVLNGFTGISFQEKIAQFKRMDQEFMDLTKEEMYVRLPHQLPASNDSVEVSRELNILRRAISSNGRGLSIRTLFEQIPHILTRLCPCMLMSPISAAQYLQAENDLFDIVIFDEASQLPTCKAVGALARGRNAVITGDPNQMPPTSFFAGNTIDEDNLDIEDLDSILDDCLALGMPSAHLHWHYRSRHESLIAFSNQEFYENSMLTFPSVNDRERRVSLVRTEGFFDRGKGRVNEGEAKAIVAEIRSRYEDPARRDQTIGVVTFNISQQTLIEDLLLEEFQRDDAFDKWANVGEEPLFVKNLENVQGDERDVILFSVAFGPDAEGKLSLNFGPLNKNGGWKRLNVAVTRARSEMMVFTTMTADQIDLKRTKARGVEALKDFLAFAQNGRLQGGYQDTRVQEDQGMMEHICQAIADGGYTYQKAVGHSKFKIDIAVIHPYQPDRYLAGIMLDGESYRQSSNTRDREVAQIDVLRGLGWNLYRMWTMGWWDNREKELLKLMQFLDGAKEAARQAFVEADAADQEPADTGAAEEYFVRQSPVLEVEDQKIASGKTESTEVIRQADPAVDPVHQADPEYAIAEYQCADIEVTELSTADYVKKENLTLIAERMQQLIDAEAPISYDRLVKKTLRAFHITRSGPQTLEVTDKALKKVSVKLNRQAGVKFYWRKDQEPESYRTYRKDTDFGEKRSMDEICQQELKNAVCFTLKEQGAMDKDSLLKAVIRTMGYTRSSAALLAAAERGLKYRRKTGEIVQDEERRFVILNKII